MQQASIKRPAKEPEQQVRSALSRIPPGLWEYTCGVYQLTTSSANKPLQRDHPSVFENASWKRMATTQRGTTILRLRAHGIFPGFACAITCIQHCQTSFSDAVCRAGIKMPPWAWPMLQRQGKTYPSVPQPFKLHQHPIKPSKQNRISHKRSRRTKHFPDDWIVVPFLLSLSWQQTANPKTTHTSLNWGRLKKVSI